jgi:hypothetical protein
MAKHVNLRDREIIALINARAAAEGRTAQNAASQTIREALTPIYGTKRRSFKQDIVEKSTVND